MNSVSIMKIQRSVVDYTWQVSTWLAMLASFGFTWSRISWRGRASAEMTYDDVVYAISGNRLARSIEQNGLIDAAVFWISNRPHAPLIDLVSATASLLGGPSTPRIYFANMLFVGILSYFAIAMTLNTDSSKTRLVLAIAIVSPLGYFYSDQFRPDPAYSVVLVFFVSSTIRAVRCLDSDKSAFYARCAGLSIPFLLLIKPSFFVFTGFACIGLFIWALILGGQIGFRPLAKRILRPAFQVSVIPLIFVIWLVLPNAIDYVIKNMLGANAKVWTGPTPVETVSQSLRAFLTSGFPAFLWIFIFGISLIILVIGKRFANIFDSFAFLTVGGLSLIPLGLTRSPSIFFGLVPVSMVLAATSLIAFSALRYIKQILPSHISLPALEKRLSRNSRRVLSAATGPILVILVGLWFPMHYPTPSGLMRPINVNANLLSAVMEDCQTKDDCNNEYTARGALPLLLITAAAEVSPDSVQWEAILAGYTGDIQRLNFLTDLNGAISKTQDAQYVVVLAANADYVNPRLPINQVQVALDQFLRDSEEWVHISVPLINQKVTLYSRILP